MECPKNETDSREENDRQNHRIITNLESKLLRRIFNLHRSYAKLADTICINIAESSKSQQMHIALFAQIEKR